MQVSGLTSVSAIASAAGSSHSVALKSDGTVWAWGLNSSGQLGNNSTTMSKVPVQVSGLSGATRVAGGSAHSVALKSDGTVWAWGLNSSGQLGNNSTAMSKVPVQASGLSGIATIGTGLSHSLSISKAGVFAGWGLNSSGQLGDNTTTNRLIPTTLTSLTLGNGARYTYNGDGLRMSKSATSVVTSFAWNDLGSTPTMLVDGTTNYVYGPGGIPLEQISGSAVLYYVQDQLGSTRALTNSSGAAVATMTYDSNGKLAASTGSVTTPFGYAGEYLDSESGLIYLRNRYYDPGTGQFLTRDPRVAFTHSAYGYADDNPINRNDATGLNANGVTSCAPGSPNGGDQVGAYSEAVGHVSDAYKGYYGEDIPGAGPLAAGLQAVDDLKNGDSVGRTALDVGGSTAGGAIGGTIGTGVCATETVASAGVGAPGCAVIVVVFGAAGAKIGGWVGKKLADVFGW